MQDFLSWDKKDKETLRQVLAVIAVTMLLVKYWPEISVPDWLVAAGQVYLACTVVTGLWFAWLIKHTKPT